MFSALGTYGLSRTQHYHNIQQADTVGDDIIADGESKLKRLMGVRATRFAPPGYFFILWICIVHGPIHGYLCGLCGAHRSSSLARASTVPHRVWSARVLHNLPIASARALPTPGRCWCYPPTIMSAIADLAASIISADAAVRLMMAGSMRLSRLPSCLVKMCCE